MLLVNVGRSEKLLEMVCLWVDSVIFLADDWRHLNIFIWILFSHDETSILFFKIGYFLCIYLQICTLLIFESKSQFFRVINRENRTLLFDWPNCIWLFKFTLLRLSLKILIEIWTVNIRFWLLLIVKLDLLERFRKCGVILFVHPWILSHRLHGHSFSIKSIQLIQTRWSGDVRGYDCWYFVDVFYSLVGDLVET